MNFLGGRWVVPKVFELLCISFIILRYISYISEPRTSIVSDKQVRGIADSFHHMYFLFFSCGPVFSPGLGLVFQKHIIFSFEYIKLILGTAFLQHAGGEP